MITLSLVVALGAGCKRSPLPVPAAGPAPQPASPTEPQLKPGRPTDLPPHLLTAKLLLDWSLEAEKQQHVTGWTTFRQLDSFISASRYSEFATLTQLAAVKSMVRSAWRSGFVGKLSEARTRVELDRFVQQHGLRGWEDYRTTSEHFRILLSVAMEEIYRPTGLPEAPPARAMELASLATELSLKLLRDAGKRAETDHSPLIDARHVQLAWQAIAKVHGLADTTRPGTTTADITPLAAITGGLIRTKTEALRHFNATTGTIRGDLERAIGMAIDDGVAEALFSQLNDFALPMLRGVKTMRGDTHLPQGTHTPAPVEISEFVDAALAVNVTLQRFPHVILANGDVTLRWVPNPRLRGGQLQAIDQTLLNHEMSAVRDSAIHWLVLRRAWDKALFALDPFAAEYISEVVSMKATLLILGAKKRAATAGAEAISLDHLTRAHDKRYSMVSPYEPATPAWTSEKRARKAAVLAAAAVNFADMTAEAGLSAALDAARLSGPGKPSLLGAMGAGIGVGDLTGDGLPDLYLAGEGLGRLYANAAGVFADVTTQWGLPSDVNDSRAAVFFDANGDGDVDLLIVRSSHPSILALQKDGRFHTTELPTGRGAHAGAGSSSRCPPAWR